MMPGSNLLRRCIQVMIFLAFLIMALIAAGAPDPDPNTGASASLKFTILHTNDEHSNLIAHPSSDYHSDNPNPASGGFARLAGAVSAVREQKSTSGEPVLLLSGGDILGGTPFGWLTFRNRAAELSLMHAIGYDAVTIGNHEFDYGSHGLACYLQSAGYPQAHETTAVLSANMIIPDDHPLREMEIRRTHMMRLDNGLKAGLFGLLGEDAITVAAFTEPVEFKNPLTAARQAVDELLQAGADIIIAVTHAGVEEDRLLAREIPEIHVIAGGHSHTPLYEPVMVGKTVIVQAGSALRYLGMLELEYFPGEDRIQVRNPENSTPYLLKLDDSVPEDPEIARRVQEYESELNTLLSDLTEGDLTDIRHFIAAAEFPLHYGPPKREATIGNFITDAMRIIGGQVTGERVDVAVQGNGVIRGDLVPGSMHWSEGRISTYDLLSVIGLGSGKDGNPGFPMVSVYLSEDELRRVMEISILLSEFMSNVYFLQYSGLQMEYDPGRAILLRIPFTGTPIPTYRAVLNAGIYSGSGLQKGNNFEPVRKGGSRLVHVVTDYYVAGFLPFVGEILPDLAIVLRDEQGNPAELNDRIILDENRELKVWDAVQRYVMQLDRNDDGLPVIPDYYQTAGNRLVIVSTIPFWFWFLTAAILITLMIVVIIRKRKFKRHN